MDNDHNPSSLSCAVVDRQTRCRSLRPSGFAGWFWWMVFCRGLFWGPRRGWPISNQHYTFSMIQVHEGNAGGLEGAVDSMARILAHLERVGLQALQRGQGYHGLVGELLLRPPKKRTRSSHLARGDHS